MKKGKSREANEWRKRIAEGKKRGREREREKEKERKKKRKRKKQANNKDGGEVGDRD